MSACYDEAAVRIRPSRWTQWVPALAAAWVILALGLGLSLGLPLTTMGWRGWVVLLAAGPPAYLALEWASGRLFSPESGARISSARFSLARIAVALAVTLIVLVPFAWWFVRQSV